MGELIAEKLALLNGTQKSKIYHVDSHITFPLRHYITLNTLTLPTATAIVMLSSMNLP